MKSVKAWLTVLMMLPACAVIAQEKPAQSDDLMDSLQQWARDNIDDSVLAALQQEEQERVRQFFTALETQFEGTNIYRLIPLKESARQLLPTLQQYEETQPFAAWLQARLDYLDAAEELQREVRVTPVKPGNALVPPAPTAQLERSVWNKTLDKRPLPPHAGTYVPRLKPVFAAAGAPSELVWLAEVESSFDPRARSPAGAAGLFQLMPETARSKGLSTWPFDERLQPEKSARAAAERLRQLYNHYGDWRLALAAYNAGEGRVDNLLKKSKTRSFDAIARHLPAETQMYVPKVEATLRHREGLTLAELKMPTLSLR
jgi:membrane-bound lytic murein transglycosylase D